MVGLASFIIVLFWLIFLSSKRIFITQRHFKFLLLIIIISLSYMAFQFRANSAVNYDLTRINAIIDFLRRSGRAGVVSYYGTNASLGGIVLYYFVSKFPDNRYVSVIACLIVYGIFAFILCDCEKRNHEGKFWNPKTILYSIIIFEGVCDYGYRVVTEIRNAIAFSLICLAVYLYIYYHRVIISIILCVIAVTIHLTSLVVAAFFLFAIFFPHMAKKFGFVILFWQIIQNIVGNILVKMPINYLNRLGAKIIAYSDYYERRHIVFVILLFGLMLAYCIVINRIDNTDSTEGNEIGLNVFLFEMSMLCLGSINTVVSVRFPIIIGFFSPIILYEYIYKRKKADLLSLIIIVFSILIAAYWILYMYVGLQAYDATWLF